MAPVKRRVFQSKKQMAEELAKYTADLSSKFCKERGIFTVVLSGGDLISWLWSVSGFICKTKLSYHSLIPFSKFCFNSSNRKLLEAPYIDSVEWSKWHIFWVDERVCGWDDADSNYKLAYDGFLSKVHI